VQSVQNFSLWAIEPYGSLSSNIFHTVFGLRPSQAQPSHEGSSDKDRRGFLFF
jgi:hypothetical protein